MKSVIPFACRRLAVLLLLGVPLLGAPLRLDAQERPMHAEIFPVEDDEPEAVTEPEAPAVPAAPVAAPLPPRRPSPSPAAVPPVPAANPGPGTASAAPVAAPLPPQRPVAATPPAVATDEAAAEEAAPVSPPAASADASRPAEAAPAEPGREIVVDDRPNLVVAFAPPIAEPATTEEIEAEEAQAPEPTHVEKQTDAVDLACLRPEVMSLVRVAGEHFGATPVITSGQRNRGRRGSLHRRCMAADFFVPGIERARLAKFLRTLPGAGGVGP
ncbi:MAG: D-Ala-D-Ala carboxypeptidase family metallohydrolase [Rhabdaerophilum calidifontis]